MENVSVIQRISRCGVVNNNNVVYSKEEYERAITDYFNKYGGGIPVTYGSTIYEKPSCYVSEITSVDLRDVIGHIPDIDHIKESVIEIIPLNGKKEEVDSLIENNCRIGPRYVGRTSMKSDGVTHVSDMRIIAFDILRPDQYRLDSEWGDK